MPNHVHLQESLPLKALNTSQVMEVLGISRNTVRKLVASGQIRTIRVGRRILFPATAIVEFLESAEIADPT